MASTDPIEVGRRVKALLDDPAVQDLMAQAKAQNYTLFRIAKTEEERVTAQARAQVMETWESLLLAVVAVGERSEIERDKQKEREDRDARDRAHSARPEEN